MKKWQTHWQFWIWIPIILSLSFVYRSVITLYVYVDEYSFTLLQLAIYISILLFSSGMGYFFNRNKTMNDKLTKRHKRLTIFGMALCVFITIVLLIKNNGLNEVQDIKQFSTFSLDQGLALLFMLGLFIIFYGFMTYIINSVVTTFFSE